MLCPHCNGEIPDGCAICPQCDAILDPSFLDANTAPGVDAEGVPRDAPAASSAPPAAGPGAAAGHSAVPPPPVAPPHGGPGVPGVPGGTGGAGGPGGPGAPNEPGGPAGPAGSGGPRLEQDLAGQTDGTSVLQLDPEQHKETRVVKLSDLPKRRAPAAAGPAGGARATFTASAPEADEGGLDDFWGQIWLSYRRLPRLEKVALLSLVALFVTAFLPWFHVKGKGFVSGIEGPGVYSAVLAFFAIAVFWVRVSLRQVLLVLLQVAFVVSAGLVAGWALRTTTGGAEPSFGLYLTLLTGATAAVISLVAVVKT